MTSPVPTRRRLQIALALGCLAGFRTWVNAWATGLPRDFEQVWFAARCLLHGVNPYPLVGPGRTFELQFGLFYPLTAGVAAVPLAPLPGVWASVVFMLIGGACFAWALMEHGYEPLLGFMGAGMVFAAEVAQWSPLYAAALVLPPIGFFFAAKPTIGAAMFVARPTWWPIVGGLVLGGIAFAAQPLWLAAWRGALAVPAGQPGGAAPYLPPIRHAFGWLIPIVLLRWRRPEARLVAALACVPQTTLLYEAAPLFLVPRTWRQAAVLVVLSYVASVWPGFGIDGTAAAYSRRILATGQGMTLLLYLPCVWMILRRPNVSDDR